MNRLLKISFSFCGQWLKNEKIGCNYSTSVFFPDAVLAINRGLDTLMNFSFSALLFFSSLAAYFDLDLRAREAAKKGYKDKLICDISFLSLFFAL